jgi:NADH:ubiquinone oxidoreductase subunit 3 (subunit A)
VPSQYYPVLLALALSLVVGGAILTLAGLLGRRASSGGRVKMSTYESGVPLLDASRKRISVLFFLIAIDFVVFDVEAAFLYPWVLVLRQGGWPLFWAVMVFIALILVGFAYLWRKGGLDISPRRDQQSARRAA